MFSLGLKLQLTSFTTSCYSCINATQNSALNSSNSCNSNVTQHNSYNSMQLTQQRICHKETEHRDLVQTDFPLHSILSSVFQNHMTDDVMMG